MNNSPACTRRRFLSSACLSGAVLSLPQIVPSSLLGAEAPSKKINVGFIGVGQHGTSWNLAKYLKLGDAKVVMVCDVDRDRMEFAKEKVDTTYENKDCAMTTDFARCWPGRM